MIHRRILRVPSTRNQFGVAPDINDVLGVNYTVLENTGSEFVIESWCSDLTHDPSLLTQLRGTELKKHPNSPRVIGKLSLSVDHELDAQEKTAWIDTAKGKKTINYLRKEKYRGGTRLIADEG